MKKEIKKELGSQKGIGLNTQYNYIIPEIIRNTETQINNFEKDNQIQLDLFKKEDKAPAP